MLLSLSHALLTFGPFGIFLLGLLDSYGIPLPAAMDFTLVATAVKYPDRAYFTALMAVIGSLIGNVALFMTARHGKRLFWKKEPTSVRGQKFQEWFHRYGLLTVFIPAVTPVVPFPLKVFVISAGALRTSFVRFLAVIVFARSLRFFGEAYLGIQLGEGAADYLRHNAWSLLGVAIGMALGLYWLIRLSDRRRESEL